MPMTPDQLWGQLPDVQSRLRDWFAPQWEGLRSTVNPPPWWKPATVPTSTPSPQTEFAEAVAMMIPWMTPTDQRRWGDWARTNVPEVYGTWTGLNTPTPDQSIFSRWDPTAAMRGMSPTERYQYETQPRLAEMWSILGDWRGPESERQFALGGHPTGEPGGLLDLDSPIRNQLAAIFTAAARYAPGGPILETQGRRSYAQQRQYEREMADLMNWMPGTEEEQAAWEMWSELIPSLLGPETMGMGPTQFRAPLWQRMGRPSRRVSPYLLGGAPTRSSTGYDW